VTDDYIPFDFGSWKSGAGRECSRHGRQYGGPSFAISPRPGEIIIRRYCGLCLLDALDRAVPPLDSPP
jgi:hypothetical protein